MKGIEKYVNRIQAICIVVIAISFMVFAVLAAEEREENKFDFHKSLDVVAITVGTEDITLKEVAYYIVVAETNQNAAAHIYNPENLDAFWNMRINYRFFSGMAKDAVKDSCIRDNIYYQTAIAKGYTLSEDEEKEIEKQAIEELNKLTEYQLALIDYTKEDMIQVLTKIAMAKKYVADLMEQGYAQEDLDVDGEKYEEMAESYQVSTNDEVWSNLTIGKTTIQKTE